MIGIRSFLPIITLFVLVRESIEAACNEGCLRCVSTAEGGSECQICDPLRNFVLKNGECQTAVVSNCLLSYSAGHCSICRYGYYLTTEFKCAEVPRRTKISIQSCNNYQTIEQCLVCDFYTYERNGQCRPIMKQIPDCAVYRNPTQCQICNMKLPSYDRRACEEVPPTVYQNCLFFRHPLKCTKCKPGYDLDENYFTKKIDQNSFNQMFFTKLKFWREQYFDLIMDTPVCTWQYSIDNCKVLGYNQTCVQCEDGYTLTPNKKQCFMKPTPPVDPKYRIPNCYKFGSQNYETCSICYENYYLTDLNTRCKKHTNVVPNCSIHSQTTDSKCVYCDNPYYLDVSETNSTLACKKRTNFFNNCEMYDRANDKCTKCKDGHLFHYNNQRCSLAIPNCVTHNQTDRILKCSNCVDTHYLNDFNTACIDAKASTEGCKKYNYNAVCLECSQGYFLDTATKKCLTQDTFANCEIRSVTVKGECTTCQKQGTRSVQNDVCINLGQINLVADCLTYNTNQICTSCKTNKVPFLKDTKVTCIDFANCAALKTITDETKCGECLPGALLWENLCLKADSNNCVNSFSNNSTYTADMFVDEVPCEVCGENSYYVTGNQTQEARCISIKLGQNCLNYYSSSADISKDAVCSQCRRGYRRSGTSVTDCISNDVYPPYLATTTSPKDFKTLSQNATYSHSSSELKSSVFSGKSYDVDSSAGTFCEQTNSDLSKCLACKNHTCAVYTASSIDDLFDVSKQTSRVTYIYRTNSSKVTFEKNFTDLTLAVSDCRFCSSQNTTEYPKEANTFNIGGVIHYQCRWAHDLSLWTKSDTEMTLNITITSSSLPIGYVWGTDTSYTSSCVYSWTSTPGLIPNCKSTFNDTDLALTFNQRAMFSSCQVCLPNYVLSYGIYTSTVTYGSNNKSFKWILNECTPASNIATYYVIDNCFGYEKTFANEQNNYFCKDCGPGSYPVISQKPIVCLKNDTYYSLTKQDHCSGTRYCDERRRCREVCSPSCGPDDYCTFDGVCVKKICPYCASNTNEPLCSGTTDGCPSDKYCEQGVCKKKCTCTHDEKCDASTNYLCVPYGCGDFKQIDVYTLYANTTNRKAEKIQQLLDQQESDWLGANKTIATTSASAANADVIIYTTQTTAVETDQTSACNYRDLIIASAYENTTEATHAEANCTIATTGLASYIEINLIIRDAADKATEYKDLSVAALTSADAKINADLAVLYRNYVAGNLTAANTLKNTVEIAKNNELSIYNNLMDNISKATAAKDAAKAEADKGLNYKASTTAAETTAMAAFDQTDSAAFSTQLTAIASFKTSAASAKASAATYAADAAKYLPGSIFATEAAEYSTYAAANSTEINTIHSNLSKIYPVLQIYDLSLLAKSQATLAADKQALAVTDYAAHTATSMSAYLTTATTAETTIAGYVTTATPYKSSVLANFDSSSPYYTAANTYFDYITGNKTAATASKIDIAGMQQALTVYTKMKELETTSTDFAALLTTAETNYANNDELAYTSSKSSATYTAASNAGTTYNSLVTTANAVIAAYPSFATDVNDYKTQATTFKDTIASNKILFDSIGYAFTSAKLKSAAETNATSINEKLTDFLALTGNKDKKDYLDANLTEITNQYNGIVSAVTTINGYVTLVQSVSNQDLQYIKDINSIFTSVTDTKTSANSDYLKFEDPNDASQGGFRALPIRSEAEFRLIKDFTLKERFQHLRNKLQERKLRMVSRMLYTREEFSIQVDNMWWGPGCSQTSFCHSMVCYNNTGCPVCPKHQMCSRIARPGGYNYVCVNDNNCANTCKTANKFCHSQIAGNGAVQFSKCDTYAQRVLDTTAAATTCSPACQTGEICIDNVCNKAFDSVCRWEFNNTVPIYCGSDENCENEVCIKNCQPKCESGYWCERSNNTCIPVISPPVRENYISRCVKVDGCATDQTSRVLNDCLRCNATSAFEVTYSNNQITSVMNRTCIDVGINGCKYAYRQASNNIICVECDKGYTLQDGTCLLSIRNCKEFDAVGNCRWCTDDYTNESRMLMNGTFEKGGCKSYPEPNYKQTANFDTDGNCAYFKYYYTSLKKPVAISGGESFCHKCKDAYFLTNGLKCFLKTITNCIDYDKTVTSQSAVICTQCDVGFSLSADKKTCTDNTPTNPKYLIPQCKRYDTNKSCLLCNDNYMLKSVGTNANGQNTYCFEKKHNDPNCAEVDSTVFASTGAMVCKTCNKISGAFAYPAVLGTGIKTCMPIAQRANCAVQNSGAFANDYICLQCDNNLYYLDIDLICQKRLNLVKSCEVYKIDEDVCQKEKTTTTDVVVSSNSLPVDVQRLIASPPVKLDTDMIVDFKGWIMGCKIYADSATCYSCYPPKYLNPQGVEYNTKCKTVNRPIAHCSWYAEDGETCLECDFFYLLKDNQCILKTAQNCLEYEDADTCKSCPSRYPIIDEDGNCGVDPNNPWCLEYDNSIPGLLSYECDICMENYYPNDSGICTRVNDPIKACKYYWSDRVCKQCEESYYLRYDGKFCDINPSFDEMCVEFSYGTECSVCEFGYYLVNGKCVACPSAQGCAYCNSTNTTQCLMCKFGYDMNSKGECVAKEGAAVTEYIRTYFFYSKAVDDSAQPSISGLASESSSVLNRIVLGVISLVFTFLV